MQLDWLDRENLDPRDLAGAVAVLEAARQVDCPHELSPTTSTYAAQLRHGWDGDPPVVGLARDGSSRVLGVLEVWLPHWDNTHSGSVDVTVDPLARRQGLGRRLFELGVDKVRAAGRSLTLTDCFDLPGSVAFCRAMGLEQASAEVQRRQDLRALDWARLDREFAAAQQRAADYELVRLAGPIPEELLAAVVWVAASINDAPIDDLDIEDEVFSPQRQRAFEAAQAAMNQRHYRLVARHCDSGDLAGHTMVAVDTERPGFGTQEDTSVLRAHRGRRLGLFLKIAMLRWLQEEEPQLRTLDTWNAESNAHMIAVNEALGYTVVARAIDWQRHL